MPEERPSSYPNVTTEEWAEIVQTTPREVCAARCVATHMMGTAIPTKGFLTGGSDHSPMMQGLIAHCKATYALVDNLSGVRDHLTNGDLATHIEEAAEEMMHIMETPRGLR